MNASSADVSKSLHLKDSLGLNFAYEAKEKTMNVSQSLEITTDEVIHFNQPDMHERVQAV